MKKINPKLKIFYLGSKNKIRSLLKNKEIKNQKRIEVETQKTNPFKVLVKKINQKTKNRKEILKLRKKLVLYIKNTKKNLKVLKN